MSSGKNTGRRREPLQPVKKKKTKTKQIQEDKKTTKMIVDLAAKAEMPEEDLRRQYASFISICPDGIMTKEKFVELSKLSVEVIEVKEEGKGVVLKESADEIERIGEEAQFLADSLFRVFDEDNSGAMLL
ncbi:uncharacterized protein LOC111709241 [Eurytemora carolleeae]|uniref:uncharacterized protein LOC111709241 n=1 Tax=Eurytemora carolleeae TaxID=1294199 RepID=UPI000C788825|nr:uncharacterized protein LOC111709241 [Eurytemora carolleeae]|eukprot:XP_023338636.1 uncharacterized protein LOC111709241 [Eurytemora affinis]